MTSRYWIKLYHEILDDPKMGRLPDGLFRRAVEFFLMAGETGRDGGLPALADMAWRLRADETKLQAQMEDLETLNIVSRDTQGEWRVTHFAKRQAPSPAMECMRRSRESALAEHFRKKKASYEDDAFRNTDTDIDKEKEKDEDEQMSRQRCLPEANSLRGSPRSAPAERCEKPQNSEYPSSGSMKLPISGHLRSLHPQRTTDDADPNNELVKLFVERTGLPLYLGGEEKWAQALARMQEAEVEEGDLEQAIDECRTKGLTIASLASVVTPAIIARAKRKAGRPEEDYRRYLKGEYGDFGR